MPPICVPSRCSLSGLKLRWLLFLAFTTIAAIPVSILAMWIGQTDMLVDYTIGMSGLGMALTGVLNWWVAGILARPVESLHDAMDAVNHGNVNSHIPLLPKYTPIELQHLAQDFNQMLERCNQAESGLRYAMIQAEHANQAKAAFLNSVSHELRMSLHGMLGFAELGMAKSTAQQEKKLHQYFERIYQNTKTLLLLLDALLEISNFDAQNKL